MRHLSAKYLSGTYLAGLLLGCLLCWASPATAQARPAVSEKPYSMMQMLATLVGRWELVTEIKQEGGDVWQAMPPHTVDIMFRHKDLLLAEIPQDVTTPGFHMESYIAYDQYRKAFRKAAVDDVWGVMDIYEGNIQDSKLVLTNLKSDTSFPIGEGVWRHFRLTLEITSPKRVMHIDKSDDGGKTWQAAFRSTYTLVSP